MVLGKRHPGAAERVRFHGVGARFEVRHVNVADDVRPRGHQDFRTVLAPQIVRLDRERHLVQHTPHASIENEDTFIEDVFERLLTLFKAGHRDSASFNLTENPGTDGTFTRFPAEKNR